MYKKKLLSYSLKLSIPSHVTHLWKLTLYKVQYVILETVAMLINTIDRQSWPSVSLSYKTNIVLSKAIGCATGTYICTFYLNYVNKEKDDPSH